MSADKKRKIEDERRVVMRTVKYYFTNVGEETVCLLYRESVAVFKEYNLKGTIKPSMQIFYEISPVKKENENSKIW